MALVLSDRVQETSTTTGTGTLSLGGADTGYQTFVAGVGDGNTTYYCITDGTDWEVGLGTVTDATPDTLSRDTILESSNSDAAVNWGAGSKDVFCTLPAEKAVYLDSNGDAIVNGNKVALVLLDETTLSSTATWSVTGLNTVARDVHIDFSIQPATDDTQLELTLAGDDDTEDTGGSSYDWVGRRWFIDSSPSITQSLTGNDDDSHINVSHQLPSDPTYGNCGASNGSGCFIQGRIELNNVDVAMFHHVESYSGWRPTNNAAGIHPNFCFMLGGGQHYVNEVIGGMFLRLDSGNMAAGVIRLRARPK